MRARRHLTLIRSWTVVAESATGLLHTHGPVNRWTLEGLIGWKGRICGPTEEPCVTGCRSLSCWRGWRRRAGARSIRRRPRSATRLQPP